MKLFHISDVLSVTTGRLVSSRHIGAVYDILNFMTGDNLFTHQLPRAGRECAPWLKAQYPALMEDDPAIVLRCEDLSIRIAAANKDMARICQICAAWVEEIRVANGLPEMLPIYELGADMHTHIDPIQEAEAMVGKDRVIVIKQDDMDEEEIA